MAEQLAFNMDCMEGMKQFPDKYFDLAIVDPPYGGGSQEDNDIDVDRTGGTWAAKYGKNIKKWDIAPSKEYFKELFRISKNQIIWGGQQLSAAAVQGFHCMGQADGRRLHNVDGRDCRHI